jgi:hypothetical protein
MFSFRFDGDDIPELHVTEVFYGDIMNIQGLQEAYFNY